MVDCELIFSRGPREGVQPLVSLIVCTKNRADKLNRCLEHIGQMSAPFEWELIAVDNGSTDNTAWVIDDFLRSFPHPAKHLLVRTPGNGAGRNRAIEQSSGQILVFTDDDCYVEPSFLCEVEKAFRNPSIGYISGRIRLYDLDDYPATINESTKRVDVSEWCLKPGIVQGANMGFRRRALDQVGAFDPDFGAGSYFAGEDFELAMRVSVAGWEGGYFPAAVVWHHHGRRAKDIHQLHRFYYIGEGAVYAKALLDPLMRWRVARFWLKRMAGDLIKRGSVRRTLFVAQGAFAYWNLRYERRKH